HNARRTGICPVCPSRFAIPISVATRICSLRLQVNQHYHQTARVYGLAAACRAYRSALHFYPRPRHAIVRDLTRRRFPPYAPLCCIGGEERRSSGAVASHRSYSRRILETRLQVCPYEVARRGGGRWLLHAGLLHSSS